VLLTRKETTSGMQKEYFCLLIIKLVGRKLSVVVMNRIDTHGLQYSDTVFFSAIYFTYANHWPIARRVSQLHLRFAGSCQFMLIFVSESYAALYSSLNMRSVCLFEMLVHIPEYMVL
jgi:hypothetical protein